MLRDASMQNVTYDTDITPLNRLARAQSVHCAQVEQGVPTVVK